MLERAEQQLSNSPDETFKLGENIGRELVGGEVILLTGGLGAGKTLLTKGIVGALGFDGDEVTSPSFALVNLYPTERFNVYHIDLWRTEGSDPAFSVGLEEMLEDEVAVVIVEWAERMAGYTFERQTYEIHLVGEGDDVRKVTLVRPEQISSTTV